MSAWPSSVLARARRQAGRRTVLRRRSRPADFPAPVFLALSRVDVRGRSYTLRINRRTSHQIRVQADRLQPAALADVDGVADDRRGTVSVFNGPAPEIDTFDDPEQEAEAVGDWIAARLRDGMEPHEIGLFVRSPRELRRARAAVKRTGAGMVALSEKIEITAGRLSMATMHLAKGLDLCPDQSRPGGKQGSRS